LTLKTYTKGERVLRIEALTHNTGALRRGRDLAKFPDLVARQVLEHAVQETEAVPEPTPRVPVVVLAPAVAVTTPKVSGVGFRQEAKWRMECGHERGDDPKSATCQSVPREYLVLDPKRVQARVSGFGVNANIPGIEVWMDCETNVRRRP